MQNNFIKSPESAMKRRGISYGLGTAVVAVLTAVFAPGLHGWLPAEGATPVSTQPIFISPSPTTQVKPNIMMVLDDSGSMAWDYMPDVVSNFDVNGSGSKLYGFPSSQCNGVYYNPNITYIAPVDYTGTSYGNSTFTNAAKDGYNLSSGYVNLSTSFKAFSSDTAQAAYYYKYTGTQTTEAQKQFYNTNSVFYKECTSVVGSTTKVDGTNPVNTVFTKVTVGASSGPGGTDERTNFANWYTYYRTRMQMMKTATGLAFKTIDSNFRVGFMTINNNVSPDFLNISDFTAAQKQSFYTTLYASNPSNSTPLREALANVGRLYAGKLTTLNSATVVDPVQYSCQQNYTILSTDGFWNGTDSNVKKLDGTTTMGNEDGTLPRPFFDGASTTTTIVTPYTSTQNRQANVTTTTTKTWQYMTATTGANCSFGPPSNTQSAPMSVGNSRSGAVGYSTTNPDSSRCYDLKGGAWFCRSPSGGSPAVSGSSVTDDFGRTWSLVSPLPSGSTSGCISANTAFGNSYSSSAGVCPAVSGKYVTAQTPYSQNETISSTSLNVDLYTAQQTTTQTITNGVAGPVGPLSPSTPSYTYTSTLTSSAVSSSDTCGGKSAPCPSASGTWTAGTAVTYGSNTICAASATITGWATPTVVSTTGPTTTSGTYTVVSSSGPTAGTPTTTTTSTGGTSNTLADTAAYYYYTPLRSTALGNCTPSTANNNLCAGGPVPTADDPATWQHMTTFTLGLGTRGRMVYANTYPQDAVQKVASDYTDVYYGNAATSTTTCTWRDALTTAGAACNWPVPGADQIENVDDLWHAAVNGHGKYYGATDPLALADGLAKTLKFIVDQPKPGTAASAATTNPKVTQNNNYQFSSFFLSVEWSGDLIRQTKDLATGQPPVFDLIKRDPTTFDWSSRDQLDATTYTARNIYTKGSTGLIPFTWASLGTAGLQSYFTATNITTAPPGYPNQLTGLSQFCSSGSICISSTAQSNTTVATGGAAGEALVNFLRGDRSNEEGTVNDTTKFFRHRAHVLGDIVSAQPQYSAGPKWNYSDSGYTDYKTTYANRLPLVFAAANDGMVHAFNAGTGSEVWAYIPSFVLPRLYTLADKNYGDKHQYFVEGTPQIGDVCPKAPATCVGSDWKTIIVGGLNGGGTGYYALDITNPNSPQLLWEFTDANMGYTFGNPQITKMDNGQWVVLITSGYDNCPKLGTAAQQDCAKNGAGDGKGYLYVLDAGTGTVIATIATSEGTTTAPSGLGKIVAHEDATHVTRRVYGGDLNGNVWRFTIGSAGYSSFKLATLQDASNVAQPIMDKPQVTTVNSLPVVYVGTGRYLSTADVGSTQQQSFYAIKDPLTTTGYGSPRTSANFIRLTAVAGTCPNGTDISICSPGDAVRTLQQNAGNANDSLVNKDGWLVDFPVNAGELEFTDPKLVLGTITFTTSIPSSLTSTDVCKSTSNPSEGTSFLYMLDYLKGGVVGGSNGVAGSSLGQGIATSPQFSQLQDGSVIITTRMSGGNDVFTKGRFNSQSSIAKRVSWRELVSE